MFNIYIDRGKGIFHSSVVKPKSKYSEFSALKDDQIFLVHVEGSSGDSNGSSDTTWDIDVFNSLDEAEKCADAIDLHYDIHHVLKGVYINLKTVKEFTKRLRYEKFMDRADLIDELMIGYFSMTAKEKQKYTASIRDVRYMKDGIEKTVYASWLGYFEHMKQVHVMELSKKYSPPEKRWRTRY